MSDAERLFLGAADGFGGDALAVGDPDGEHGRGGHDGDEDVDQITDDTGNTRDVLSDPRRATSGRTSANAGLDPRTQESEEGAETKGPALPCGEVDEPA